MKKIILDTDIGNDVDDLIAISMLATCHLAPELFKLEIGQVDLDSNEITTLIQNETGQHRVVNFNESQVNRAKALQLITNYTKL